MAEWREGRSLAFSKASGTGALPCRSRVHPDSGNLNCVTGVTDEIGEERGQRLVTGKKQSVTGRIIIEINTSGVRDDSWSTENVLPRSSRLGFRIRSNTIDRDGNTQPQCCRLSDHRFRKLEGLRLWFRSALEG